MKVIIDKEEWWPVYEIKPFDPSNKSHKNYDDYGLYLIEMSEKEYAEYQRIMKEFGEMQKRLGEEIDDA